MADIFYSDTTGEMTLSSYQRDLLLTAIESLITHAKVRLLPANC